MLSTNGHFQSEIWLQLFFGIKKWLDWHLKSWIHYHCIISELSLFSSKISSKIDLLTSDCSQRAVMSKGLRQDSKSLKTRCSFLIWVQIHKSESFRLALVILVSVNISAGGKPDTENSGCCFHNKFTHLIIFLANEFKAIIQLKVAIRKQKEMYGEDIWRFPWYKLLKNALYSYLTPMFYLHCAQLCTCYVVWHQKAVFTFIHSFKILWAHIKLDAFRSMILNYN